MRTAADRPMRIRPALQRSGEHAVCLNAPGFSRAHVNSDGESPEINECVAERATALRVLAARMRPRRDDAGPLSRVVFMLGGCD